MTEKTNYYPMRVVTRMTGLTADTIRVWERRHEAVVPERTEGNTRLYRDKDIQRLILLKQVTSHGYRIKEVARLEKEKLEKLLENETHQEKEELKEVDKTYEQVCKKYLDAIEAFDLLRADRILTRVALMTNIKELALEVIVPIMQETGKRWEKGEFTVAHEHMVSSSLRCMLGRLLSFLPPQPGAKKAIFTTPEGHLHEFGILIGALLAVARGINVIYLGPNLPKEDLLNTVARTKADLVVLSVVRDTTEDETERIVDLVEKLNKNTKIWIGLPQNHSLVNIINPTRIFYDFESMYKVLTSFSERI